MADAPETAPRRGSRILCDDPKPRLGHGLRPSPSSQETAREDPDDLLGTSGAGTGLLDRFPALRGLSPGSPGRRRIPWVRQTTATDCGAACLAMVLAYHGRKAPLDEIRELLGVDRDGSDALAIANAGEWFGLRGRGVKIEEIDDLEYLPKASVLHWHFSHFVVFEGLTRDGATIVDPAAGRHHVTRSELSRAVTGVAVTFEPTADFTSGGKAGHGPGRYLKQMFEQGGVLSRLLVISVLLQMLALSLPLLTGTLVDRVVPRGDHQLLTVLAAGLAAIVVFNFLASLVRAHLVLQLRTHLDARMTLDFLDHLVSLPFAFFQRRSAGDLMMRLNSNSTIREILTSSALTAVLDGVLVCLYLVLLFATHVPMALLVVGLGLLRVGLFLATRRRHRDLMSQTLHTQARSRGYQVQLLAGIETLKVMGAEQRGVEHWSHLFVDELNVSLARGRLSAVFDSLLASLTMASPLLVLCFGGLAVLNGELSLGTMLALSALAAGFLGPLSGLVSTAVKLQLMGSYLERLLDVLETPREQDRQSAGPEGGERKLARAGELRGEISLRDVSFRYSSSAPEALRQVSVDIPAGSFVAVVGPSGAGKTTLAGLCLGLYRPTSGRVLYDGVDLDSLDLRSVRRQLGVVLQQAYLFGTSIRGNIALADPDLPLERVVEAARLANIHDDVTAMPMGYDTLVSDGGGGLSGGQRQRLALARALVHRPKVLLLDEATSQLDAVTEKAIQEQLRSLQATRIVIAHRLSTIRAADLILVLDGGRIVERGRHAELIGRGGAYSNLVAAQTEPAAAERSPAKETLLRYA